MSNCIRYTHLIDNFICEDDWVRRKETGQVGYVRRVFEADSFDDYLYEVILRNPDENVRVRGNELIVICAFG